MEYEKTTEQVIGCAYRVHNAMGFGFLESVYEKCMLIELRASELHVEVQRAISVRYNDVIVGDFTADMVVENKIIVELKAVEQLVKAHEIQLVNYLVATGMPVGLLINFGPQK